MRCTAWRVATANPPIATLMDRAAAIHAKTACKVVCVIRSNLGATRGTKKPEERCYEAWLSWSNNLLEDLMPPEDGRGMR